eukprot:GHVL01006602.1.p1 GENE.GHVL01006602.1~~GHVL01006602.1.p1  ORF type:complete len:308 (-),score=61.80 GHVL01006602.1:1195-2118(-)
MWIDINRLLNYDNNINDILCLSSILNNKIDGYELLIRYHDILKKCETPLTDDTVITDDKACNCPIFILAKDQRMLEIKMSAIDPGGTGIVSWDGFLSVLQDCSLDMSPKLLSKLKNWLSINGKIFYNMLLSPQVRPQVGSAFSIIVNELILNGKTRPSFDWCVIGIKFLGRYSIRSDMISLSKPKLFGWKCTTNVKVNFCASYPFNGPGKLERQEIGDCLKSRKDSISTNSTYCSLPGGSEDDIEIVLRGMSGSVEIARWTINLNLSELVKGGRDYQRFKFDLKSNEKIMDASLLLSTQGTNMLYNM